MFIHNICISCSNHLCILSFSQQTVNYALNSFLFMLIAGSIGWQGRSNSSMHFIASRKPRATTGRVDLAVNHGRNILQFVVRCKSKVSRQDATDALYDSFYSEVEMIILSSTTLLYTIFCVHSTSRLIGGSARCVPIISMLQKYLKYLIIWR